jgi:hypothetical protein
MSNIYLAIYTGYQYWVNNNLAIYKEYQYWVYVQRHEVIKVDMYI